MIDEVLIGIGPGKSGGIAFFDMPTQQLTAVVKMPATPKDLLLLLQERTQGMHVAAYLEKVGGMPNQGGSSLFQLRRELRTSNNGLAGVQNTYKLSTPQRWQRALGLQGKKSESQKDHKNRIKARAQQLFPEENVTLWNADALLIGYYGLKDFHLV